MTTIDIPDDSIARLLNLLHMAEQADDYARAIWLDKESREWAAEMRATIKSQTDEGETEAVA